MFNRSMGNLALLLLTHCLSGQPAITAVLQVVVDMIRSTPREVAHLLQYRMADAMGALVGTHAGIYTPRARPTGTDTLQRKMLSMGICPVAASAAADKQDYMVHLAK